MADSAGASTLHLPRTLLAAVLVLLVLSVALWARFGGAMFADWLSAAWSLCF